MNSYVVRVGGSGWNVKASSIRVAVNKGLKAEDNRRRQEKLPAIDKRAIGRALDITAEIVARDIERSEGERESMTGKDAWAALRARPDLCLCASHDLRSEERRWGIVSFANPAPREALGTGPTPELAICAALGTTLEADAPCEDTELLDALEARLAEFGFPCWLNVVEEKASPDTPEEQQRKDTALASLWEGVWPVSAKPILDYPNQGPDLRAALRALAGAQGEGGGEA